MSSAKAWRAGPSNRCNSTDLPACGLGHSGIGRDMGDHLLLRWRGPQRGPRVTEGIGARLPPLRCGSRSGARGCHFVRGNRGRGPWYLAGTVTRAAVRNRGMWHRVRGEGQQPVETGSWGDGEPAGRTTSSFAPRPSSFPSSKRSSPAPR